MLRLLIALVLLSSIAVGQEGSSTDGRLTLERVMELEDVGDPQISPDGEQVVFTRSWNDLVHDRVVRDLWIVGSDGSRPRFLTKGSDARWSPNGDRLAFLREGEPRGSQIHVMWLDTREVTQITRVDESPDDLAWAPDGGRIAFRMLVPEKEELTIELPPRPKGAEWAPDPKVVTRLSWRRDRSGDRPKGWQHLFVVDANGGTPWQVTAGEFDHGAPHWLPDGRHLVFDGLLVPDADWQVRESNLYRVDVADGAVEALTLTPGVESDPAVSPEGRHVAFLAYPKSTDTYVMPAVHVLDLESGQVREIAPGLDRRASNPMWRREGEVVFGIENEGRRSVQLVRVADARHGSVGSVSDDLVAASVARDGAIAAVVADASTPGDVAVVDPTWSPQGGVVPAEPRRITDVNSDVLRRVALGDVEEMRVPSPTDGLPIHAFLVTPPDFDPGRRYPLILAIHGGPHAMYRADFQAEFQNHAAAGYVVLYANPRGSSGYGRAFGMGIQNAYPGKDYDDLMGCVDHVVARGFVDPERLFVYGGSGGGVLTCWIVGHTDRFAAAVSMYPVTNWISFVGTTDGPYWYHNFAKLPWEDLTEHWDRSPLKYVGNVSTPTLFITGELDLRTPIGQTDEFYHALKLRKVDTAMVRVPDEYHGAAGRHPSNRMRRVLFVREWFERHDPRAAASDEPDARATGTTWTGILGEAEFAKLHELRGDSAPPLVGADVDLGGGVSGYLSLPEGEPPFPAVTVIHEWWGLNDHIRHWTDRLAAEGYAALAVDLYGGRVAASREEAAELMRAVDEQEAAAALQRAHRFLAGDRRVQAQRRGVIGWCFGGGWALRHAIQSPDLDAAVVYYGRLVTDVAQLAKIEAPVLGVFGNRDDGIPPAAVDAFAAAMAEAGNELRVLRYDADHAFANPSGARYDAENAKAAWVEVREFLADHLKR